MGGWVFLTIIAIVVLALISLYNGLVSLRARVKNAWSQIDVQLKRRHDLIPNLVETVKGYMAHERGIFDTIASARQQAQAAGDNVAARAQAENALSQSLRSLFALAESNPQLRASETMAQLQEELASTENRIAFARQHYNDSVMAYNTRIATVPSNVISGAFGFREEPLFAADPSDREPVSVKF
jgi:LemA protein